MTNSNIGYFSLLFGKKAMAVWAMCIGVGLHAINWFMVSAMAPTMVFELGGAKLISWISVSFLTASVVFGAYSGYLRRQIGAKNAMLIFALFFVAGCLLVAFAPSMEIVLLGRALQGVGEGVILALSYGIIKDVVSAKEVPQIFGLFAFTYIFSAALGPIIAGYLTLLLSWRAVFMLNIGFILIYMLLVALAIPKKIKVHSDKKTKAPIKRLLLIALGMLLFGFSSLVENWLIALGLNIIGALAIYALIKIDRSEANRLFPKDIFNLRTKLGIGFWLVFLLPFCLSSIHVFIPYLAQINFKLSVIDAGYMATVIAFSWSIMAIFVGRFNKLITVSSYIKIGILGQFIGFTLLKIAFDQAMLVLMIIGLGVIGGSIGLCWAFITQQIVDNEQNNSATDDSDLASAQIPVIQSISLAIGASLAGAIANFNGFSLNLDEIALSQALSPVFSASWFASLWTLFIGLWFVRCLKRKIS